MNAVRSLLSFVNSLEEPAPEENTEIPPEIVAFLTGVPLIATMRPHSCEKILAIGALTALIWHRFKNTQPPPGSS